MTIPIAVLRETWRRGAWPILALAGLGWAVVWLSESAIVAAPLCLSVRPSSWEEMSAVLALTTLDVSAWQGVFWLAMLLACMMPVLLEPLTHVWRRSLAERRLRAAVLFLAGYFAIWICAAAALTALAFALRIAFAGTAAMLAAAVAVAFLWQLTGWKRRSLARCHALPALPLFGLAAERARFAFGLRTGRDCVASCWAMMLVPLAAGGAHLPLMVLATWLIVAERFSAAPLFGFGGPAALRRLIFVGLTGRTV